MIYEWMRNWVKIVSIDEDGDVLEIDPFLLGNDYIRPMDIEVGPRGRLYIIEWGDQFWGSNANAQLVRLDYYGTSDQPVPAVPESPSALPLSLDWPPDGGIFDFDSTYAYRVTVHDQAIEDEVAVHVFSGFDTSPIPLSDHSGSEGEFSLTQAYTHSPPIHYVDRFALIKACLETSCRKIKLHPRLKEAEHVTSSEKSIRETYATHPASRDWRGTVLSAMPLENGSRLTYAPLNLHGIDSLTLRFRTAGMGTLRFSADTLETVLAEIEISPDTGEPITPHQAEYVAGVSPDFPGMSSLPKGAYDNWREVTLPIVPSENTIILILTFESVEEDPVMELDWIRFNGPGLAQ